MYAPTIDPHRKSLWALKNAQNSAQIYEYRNKIWSPCSQFRDTRPVSIAVHPIKENTYAFLMQKRGFQGIWLVDAFADC